MITSEFKEELEKLGYKLNKGEIFSFIKDKRELTYVRISERYSSSILFYDIFEKLSSSKRKELLNLSVEYANTSVDERKENRVRIIIRTNDNYTISVESDQKKLKEMKKILNDRYWNKWSKGLITLGETNLTIKSKNIKDIMFENID